MSPTDLSRLRGGFFGVIFQNPMSALNPMLKMGPQLAEQARRLQDYRRRRRRGKPSRCWHVPASLTRKPL